MKVFSLIGEVILLVAFIIALCKYGVVMLLAPIAIILILILLVCGCKF